MTEQHPRSRRPGGPRRPAGHRARAGGSARPMRPAAQDLPPSVAPGPATRPLPRSEQWSQAPGDAAGPPPGVGIAQGGDGPRGPESPRSPSRGGGPDGRHPRRRHRTPRAVRLGATLLVLVLVVVLGWGLGLTAWAGSRIEHIDALSGAADTPGTTYLIAGSDGRGGEKVSDDGTEGARTDTIMLLHRAPNGNSYLVSLPRDTLVDIPGYGGYKLNAAFAFGGPKLLVETVEEFTGLTIDHYVEVGFDGVADMVDAVGHVNLCIDQDVDDPRSGLQMTEGCHDVGGDQALAFVRARYFDPTADLGRQQRQQQFVGALMDRVTSPAVLLNPVAQARLAGAGSNALITSEGTGIPAIGRMALTARSAMNSGRTLSIPIEDPEYQTKHSGVAILTDEDDVAAFFDGIADGSAEPAAG